MPSPSTSVEPSRRRTRFKTLAVMILQPFARLSSLATPLRRAWFHARLASTLAGGSLDSSNVLLGAPEVHGTGRISFGADAFVYPDIYLETQGDGSIRLGDRVVLSRGVHIVSYARVEIGAGAMIGEYTSIRDANHRVAAGTTIRDAGHDAAPIRIGANVWIGRGAAILAGVTIGAGAIIGANAVVTRDVPAGAVAVGVPARPR